jgi:hypothetical protein
MRRSLTASKKDKGEGVAEPPSVSPVAAGTAEVGRLSLKKEGSFNNIINRVFKKDEVQMECVEASKVFDVQPCAVTAQEPVTTPTSESEVKVEEKKTKASKTLLEILNKVIGRHGQSVPSSTEKAEETAASDEAETPAAPPVKLKKEVGKEPKSLLGSFSKFIYGPPQGSPQPPRKDTEQMTEISVAAKASSEILGKVQVPIEEGKGPSTSVKGDQVLGAIYKKTNELVHHIESKVHQMEERLCNHRDAKLEDNKEQDTESSKAEVGKKKENATVEEGVEAAKEEESGAPTSQKWKNRISGYFGKPQSGRKSLTLRPLVSSPHEVVNVENIVTSSESTKVVEGGKAVAGQEGQISATPIETQKTKETSADV